MPDELSENSNQKLKTDTIQSKEHQKYISLISSAITNRFPGSDFLKVASQHAGVKAEELNDNWKGWAEDQKKTYEFHRQQLVDEITKSKIKPEEIDNYITTLNELFEETKVTENIDDLRDIQEILSFAKASDSLEKAKLWLRYAKEWRNRYITNNDDKKERLRINEFVRTLIDISGHNTSPRPATRSIEETDQLMQAILELYDYRYSLTPEETQKFLVKSQFYDTIYETNILDSLIETAKSIGLDRHDATQTRIIFNAIKKNQTLDAKILNKFIIMIGKYSQHHGLTETNIKGFQEKLLPALLKDDIQVQALLKGGNIWSMGPENMGIGDFVCHCYVTEIKPQNLNDLLLSIYEVPSTDFARYEQNRLDALALSSVFGALRDFIHDQRPGVSEVLQAMTDYYQTNDRSKLELLLLKTGGYLASADRRAVLLNKNYYENNVEETVNGKKKIVKAIDVLRRLSENTRPLHDKPPTTSNQTLNEKMMTLIQSRASRGVSRELLGETFNYINNLLIEFINHGEVGMEPNMVTALAWLERQGFYVLQNMNYEDQISIIKKKWFHSILQFQELTASPNNYSQEEFDGFINQVTNSENYIDAFKLVAKRILINLNKLARKYKAEGKNERIGALWSGNTAHELIGLSELKPASTEYGRKHRKEKLKPESERFKGD